MGALLYWSRALCLPGAEQLEAAKGARLFAGGARRATGAEQFETV